MHAALPYLCEGLPLDGVAIRRKYFRESQGSLHETVGAMDAALALGVVSKADAEAAKAASGGPPSFWN